VNFEQLDVEFATERTDEIGSLARLLDAMVQRLRASVTQLRAAERRATIGDLARQVNHDVRNGLLPIRNVIGHLSEVAREAPGDLANVYAEREATLQGGITYLENLAGSYARLSPRADRKLCDLNMIVRSVVGNAGDKGSVRLQLDLGDGLPRVPADPVALRRILENLTINAVESLEGHAGAVTVKTSLTNAGAERRVLLLWPIPARNRRIIARAHLR
jgi:signal transduction histidine kinase